MRTFDLVIVGGGIGAALADPVAVGVILGLVVGKLIGVFGSTWLMARFTNAELHDDLSWSDVAGLSVLTGVGFTVSLLVGELAFGVGSDRDDHVKLGIIIGSLTAAIISSVILRRRNKVYRQIEENETRDDDGDGIPDYYQEQPDPGSSSTR